jgi:hypothetical protein
MNTTLSPGQSARVRKYGKVYACRIVRVTPTRYLVSFTQVSGRTVERWVPQADVLGDAQPSAGRIARDVRITTDADTMDLLAIRDGSAPEHIRNAAVAELRRRGFGTL